MGRSVSDTPKKIRVTLDSGRGAVLLEGDDLQAADIQAAVRGRFADEGEFVRAMRALLVTYDDGTRRFAFKAFNESTRVVGDTIYL